MAEWPSTLPAPQKNINITPGDTRKERKLQSGRLEFRRFGDGKPDQVKVLFRLTWAEWDIFKEFYAHDLNFGINWFSADWLTDLGYDAHKARILGYPREVALQSYYVDVLCNLIIQKTAWIVGTDTEWPCEATGGTPTPPDHYGYIYGGKGTGYLQDCDQYNSDLNAWTVKSNMPDPLYALAASTIGSSGYTYGGENVRDCSEYTPDTWTSKSDMPTPARKHLAASTIGSSGYVYGGNVGTSYYQDCDQYTPDTWVSASNMPAPGRYGLAASTIGNNSYVYGGNDGSSNLQDCDQYTPNTWTSKTNMPAPARFFLSASTIGSSGYVYGGYYGGYLQDCDQYTPNTWVSKNDMPAPARDWFAASTIGSSGYVYGGDSTAGALQDCDQYTPNTWTSKTNMPAPARYGFAASTI